MIVVWVGLLYFYYFLSWWSISDFVDNSVLKLFRSTPYIHFEVLIEGIVFGLLFGIVNTLTDRAGFHRKSFGHIILLKSLAYLGALSITAAVSLTLFHYNLIMPFEEETNLKAYFSYRLLIASLSYILIAIIGINFILQVNRKFGPGNLWAMLTGAYHFPKNETRIFMFLDMKDSTGLAEKLGHNKYSHLLRSCFHDLNEVLIEHRAGIYQYVGDEVVLYWDLKNGFKNINCIETYFAFVKKISSHSRFYQREFGTVPHFKAGMDMGEVTITEVGELKREIAFHGDVLNTAARIQEYCSQHNSLLLISEHLQPHLPLRSRYQYKLIGRISLKGKRQLTGIYSVLPQSAHQLAAPNKNN